MGRLSAALHRLSNSTRNLVQGHPFIFACLAVLLALVVGIGIGVAVSSSEGEIADLESQIADLEQERDDAEDSLADVEAEAEELAVALSVARRAVRKAEARAERAREKAASATAPADSGSDGTYTVGDFTITDVQVTEDFVDDFEIRARVTNNGGRSNFVELQATVFSGGKVVAVAEAIENFDSGQTRTVTFVSTDKYREWDEVEFTVDKGF